MILAFVLSAGSFHNKIQQYQQMTYTLDPYQAQYCIGLDLYHLKYKFE